MLLVLVFISPQLMSPIHFAFMHHYKTHERQTRHATLSVPEKHCNYCDFHFFHFINDLDLYVESRLTQHLFNTRVTAMVSLLLTSYTDKAVLGRAPPQT